MKCKFEINYLLYLVPTYILVMKVIDFFLACNERQDQAKMAKIKIQKFLKLSSL